MKLFITTNLCVLFTQVRSTDLQVPSQKSFRTFALYFLKVDIQIFKFLEYVFHPFLSFNFTHWQNMYVTFYLIQPKADKHEYFSYHFQQGNKERSSFEIAKFSLSFKSWRDKLFMNIFCLFKPVSMFPKNINRFMQQLQGS